MRRRFIWRTIALVLSALVLFAWFVGESSSFRECVCNSKDHNAGEAPQKRPNISTVTLYKGCLGTFLNENNGAITALATVVIALFTIALAAYTKGLGDAAIKQDARMRESIRVSKEAMKLSERALVASERAFVSAQNIYSLYEPIPDTELYRWRFCPVWTNSGNTPTKNLTINVASVLRDAVLPEEFDLTQFPFPDGLGQIPPKTTLTGGQTPPIPLPGIGPQDILEIQEGRKHLYMWGCAKYHDVFPNSAQHITRFCWIVIPSGDPMTFKPESTLREERLQFSYIQHTKGNCADEECA